MRLTSQLQTIEISEEPESRPWQVVHRLLDQERQRTSELENLHRQVEARLYPQLMEIVEKSVAEISVLDVKLVNVIRLIRSELELPFDEDHYLQVIHSSHEKLRGSLHEFQNEWSDEHEQAPSEP